MFGKMLKFLLLVFVLSQGEPPHYYEVRQLEDTKEKSTAKETDDAAGSSHESTAPPPVPPQTELSLRYMHPYPVHETLESF